MLLFILTVLSSISFAGNFEKDDFKELNTGVCGYTKNCPSNGSFFGASLLRVKTFEGERINFEFKYGVAFPTIVTAKALMGVPMGPVNLSLGARVFPITVGPEIKIKSGNTYITVSYEYWHLFPSDLLTVGLQWRI